MTESDRDQRDGNTILELGCAINAAENGEKVSVRLLRKLDSLILRLERENHEIRVVNRKKAGMTATDASAQLEGWKRKVQEEVQRLREEFRANMAKTKRPNVFLLEALEDADKRLVERAKYDVNALMAPYPPKSGSDSAREATKSEIMETLEDPSSDPPSPIYDDNIDSDGFTKSPIEDEGPSRRYLAWLVKTKLKDYGERIGVAESRIFEVAAVGADRRLERVEGALVDVQRRLEDPEDPKDDGPEAHRIVYSGPLVLKYTGRRAGGGAEVIFEGRDGTRLNILGGLARIISNFCPAQYKGDSTRYRVKIEMLND